VTSCGSFLKPLSPSDVRSERELAFYQARSRTARPRRRRLLTQRRAADRQRQADACARGDVVALALACFLPVFYGVAEVKTDAADELPANYIQLGDVTSAFRRPCVADIKVRPSPLCHSRTHAASLQLGYRTSDEALCGAAHALKCAPKDAATTSAALGFRLAGVRAWEAGCTSGCSEGQPGPAWSLWQPSRAECRALDGAALRHALRRFFAAGDSGPACERTSTRLAARLCAAEKQLAACAAALGNCIGLRLLSASLLIVLDSESNDASGVRLVLIDFAHAFQLEPTSGSDGNTCGGMAALGAMLARLRVELEG